MTKRPVPARYPSDRELYIEQEDFMEDPPKNYRLAPEGRRLKDAYIIRCDEVVKDAEAT